MAARTAITILLLTRHMIVRADFSSSSKLNGVWRKQRPDAQDWTRLVEAALALGPVAASRVFVLSTDLWTQTIALEKSASAGMSPADLASALNFEAEALSGQSAFESVVAVQPLPPGDGYWIVQARLTDLEQADAVIRKAGGRLGGLLHPAGVPASLDQRETRWARLEFWPDAVVLLRGDWQGPASVQVLNADPQLGRWRGEWDQWRHGMGDAEALQALVGPGMNVAPPMPFTLALDDETQLSAWLTAWAAQLSESKPDVPLLRPARKPITTSTRVALSAALALFVLAVCFACQFWLNRGLANDRAEIKALEEPAKKFADTHKKLQELESKRKDLKAQAEHFEQSVKVLKTQRHRHARLLRIIMTNQPDDLQVKGIEAESGEPRLTGVCLQPELADQFAHRLAKALVDHGWEVQAPKKQALKLTADGGPWSFEITIRGTKSFMLEPLLESKKDKK